MLSHFSSYFPFSLLYLNLFIVKFFCLFMDTRGVFWGHVKFFGKKEVAVINIFLLRGRGFFGGRFIGVKPTKHIELYCEPRPPISYCYNLYYRPTEKLISLSPFEIFKIPSSIFKSAFPTKNFDFAIFPS